MSSTGSTGSRPGLTDPSMAYRNILGPTEMARAEGWLAQVSYRPNVHLRLQEDTWGMALLVEMEVEDTYNPGRQIRVAHRRALTPYVWEHKDTFIAAVGRALEYVEVHECREWFKWRSTGRPVNDPHAEDGGRQPTA